MVLNLGWKETDMAKEPLYLDTYALQQDMRIRLPKSIMNNLPVEKGTTKFSIYLDQEKRELILRIAKAPKEEAEWNTLLPVAIHLS